MKVNDFIEWIFAVMLILIAFLFGGWLIKLLIKAILW